MKLISTAEEEEKLKVLDKMLFASKRWDKNLYFGGLVKERQKASWWSDSFTLWQLAYMLAGLGFAEQKCRFDVASIQQPG